MHSTKTKRFGAFVVVYSCSARREGQPSNHILAGNLPTDWEEAGP